MLAGLDLGGDEADEEMFAELMVGMMDDVLMGFEDGADADADALFGTGAFAGAAGDDIFAELMGSAAGPKRARGRGGGRKPSRPARASAEAAAIAEGSRVLVRGRHEGVVRFAGSVHYAKGEWFGVELADAVGKNDGAVKGRRYFDAAAQHGIFVRAADLQAL